MTAVEVAVRVEPPAEPSVRTTVIFPSVTVTVPVDEALYETGRVGAVTDRDGQGLSSPPSSPCSEPYPRAFSGFASLIAGVALAISAVVVVAIRARCRRARAEQGVE